MISRSCGARVWFTRIGTSRRYEPAPGGLRAMTALVILREKVIRPLLAATQRPEPQTKLNHPTPIDHHYEQLRTPECENSSPPWGWRHRIDNPFFIFCSKTLAWRENRSFAPWVSRTCRRGGL